MERYFCGLKTVSRVNQQAVADPVAQLVEHNTFNVGVPGSSPGGITGKLLGMRGFLAFMRPLDRSAFLRAL